MAETTEEHIFANALNQSLQIDAVALKKFKEQFGSFKKAWHSSLSALKTAADKRILEEFRPNINPEKEFEKLEKQKIKVLLKNELPLLLREIDTPPEILYVKGTLPLENKNYLAVVGPRRFSSYGKEVCERIVGGLKEHNFAIISGLASGIDSIAHETALKNNIPTPAVLGNGLDENVLFPPRNIKLYKEIIENNGAVISEYHFSMKAALYTFPQRNRIVAGLCQGTLVVEAPERSGSLITAFLSLDYNRDVFAVPGSVFSANSKGVNLLLKMGAIPVTETNDILRAFGIEQTKTETTQNLSAEEEKIIFLLREPMERDEIIRKTKLPPYEINPLLIKMEIKGIIKEIDGKICRTCA